MKKLIVFLLILAVIVGGYLLVAKYVRAPMTMLGGKPATARLGDLNVPITASGHIKPATITTIKSEASGAVVEIPYEVGEYVKAGDLVLRLDRTDEQSKVDQATAELERARIAKAKAEIAHRQARDVGVAMAEANLRQTQAQTKLAEVDFNHKKRLRESGGASVSDIEFDTAEAKLDQARAVVAAAESELAQAKVSVDLAEKDIATAQQAVNAAQRYLDDANERLNDTEVLSPISGMIVSRRVQVGEVVVSGREAFTGGTVLMEIADISAIYAEVNVDEADIGLVRELISPEEMTLADATKPATLPEGTIQENQEVEITVEAFPDETFAGEIERVSPQSEVLQAIATFSVRIRITSENVSKLRYVLNSQAQANFTVRSVTNAVLVPYEAMKSDPTGDGYGVYIVSKDPQTGKDQPKFVPCKFGVDNRVDVEVIEGIEAGQEVYIDLPIRTRGDEPRE